MLPPSENISTVATLQSWCLKMTLSISTKTFTFHKDKNSLWMTPKPSLQTLHISDPAARDKLDKKYIQVGVYTGRRPTVGQHLPVHISFWDKWLTELFFPETFDWRTFVHIVHTNLWLCHHWSRPGIIDFVVVVFLRVFFPHLAETWSVLPDHSLSTGPCQQALSVFVPCSPILTCNGWLQTGHERSKELDLRSLLFLGWNFSLCYKYFLGQFFKAEAAGRPLSRHLLVPGKQKDIDKNHRSRQNEHFKSRQSSNLHLASSLRLEIVPHRFSLILHKRSVWWQISPPTPLLFNVWSYTIYASPVPFH